MIDIYAERMVPLKEVPAHLPKRKGKRLHYSSVFRWVSHGLRGKRLETVRIGGFRFTSIEALNRFFAEPHCDPSLDRGARREAAIARAQAELDAEGV